MVHITERLPKFSASMSIEIPGEPNIHLNYLGDVPSEIMDQYKQFIGDGLARVSVTTDMGIKDFGTGVSCSVTVSLTCDQSSNGIATATQFAGAAAMYYVKEQRERADQELQQILALRPPRQS